jgi:hypothetical protein
VGCACPSLQPFLAIVSPSIPLTLPSESGSVDRSRGSRRNVGSDPGTGMRRPGRECEGHIWVRGDQIIAAMLLQCFFELISPLLRIPNPLIVFVGHDLLLCSISLSIWVPFVNEKLRPQMQLNVSRRWLLNLVTI